MHCKLVYTELQLICELSYSYSFFLNQPAAVRSASTLTFHESVSWAWKQRPSSPWLLLAKSASSEHTRALYGKNTELPKLSGPGLIWFAVRKQRSLKYFQFSIFKGCIWEVVNIKLCDFSFVCLFVTEEIQYHDGLRSRELGQAPILLCVPNS